METATGMTLQEAARPTGTAKSSTLQFRWLDTPRSIGTKADTVEHGSVGGNDVLHQVLQRAIQLEASLKDMTSQRDKWVLQADYWREQAQRQLTIPASTTILLVARRLAIMLGLRPRT
jgi:hypothetical protein